MIENKPVRDPVYGYIELTSIEQTIIDRPEFQRLRFVLQNSSAFQTYPSNLGMRFLHSLGVMHLSGEMCRRAFENANRADLVAYLAATDVFVTRIAGQMEASFADTVKGWAESLGNMSRFNHQPLLESPCVLTPRQQFLINLIWQSVRLCAMIHDIGHFPMSHVFEDALKEFRESEAGGLALFRDEWNRRNDQFADCLEPDTREAIAKTTKLDEIPLHEWWGFKVFHSIRPTPKELSEPALSFCKLAYRLAKLMFLVNRAPVSAEAGDHYGPLRCLHTIVSGDLDADRLDYCVRDPRASGVELGAIDVRRIIDSMVLIRRDERFLILPRLRAISALESFFHQRYLLYQYLIYHHNVVRMDGIVKAIIMAFLREATSTSSPPVVRQTLDLLGFWCAQPSKHGFHMMAHAGWEHYDDAWLRTVMAEVRWRLLEERRRADTGLSREHGQLFLLLDTFLCRRRQNLFSLWKFDSSFQESVRAIAQSVGLPGETGETRVVKILRAGGEYAPGRRPAIVDQVVAPLSDALAEKGVCVLYRHLKPRILDPPTSARGTDGQQKEALAVLTAEENVCLARNASPYLRSLELVAGETPCMSLSFVADSIKNSEGLITECRDSALKLLTQFVKSGLEPDHP